MLKIQPVPETSADGKVAQTYERLHDLLGPDPLPEPFLYLGSVEAFLRDFYMNFKKFVWSEGKLDVRNKGAVALATAVHAESQPWADFFKQRCLALGWSETQIAEIVAVASTNYMYNTFFKFRVLGGTDRFEGFPVGLRAHTFSGTSLEESTVEVINLAISDINACGPCVSGHVAKAEQLGLSHEAMLEAIQCAATVYAGAKFTNATMPA
ncbi:MAG: carboxymuconolactone decarboxylase family protein [Planctomycetaceae bacterium]|nr:carboxymuconolactone decarboxylase family protein [Planctomycetaceae bacterium]